VARTVTQAFQDQWAKKGGKRGVLRVRYKRRYWNGAAYVYESLWTDLNEGDFSSIGDMPYNLDVPFANVFKATSITLRLNNANNEWIQSINSPSIFAADTTAALGYEPVWTQFQVQYGYVLADGTKEYTSLFTGLAVNYIFAGDDAGVEVTVESNARLMRAADASKVSDTFTNEATVPAVGDGVTQDFETQSEGVGRITLARKNSVAMSQGVDYTISQLNGVGEPAIIHIDPAPQIGDTIDASGISWKANLEIHALIALLCDESSIGAGSRTIEDVLFPGGLSAKKIIDTQVDWEAGTLIQDIDTDLLAGAISREWFLIDDFADNEYTTNPVWTPLNFGGTISAASGKLVLSNTPGDGLGIPLISTPFTQTVGTWRMNVETTRFGNIYLMMNNNSHYFGGAQGNGYSLNINLALSSIKLERYTAASRVTLITGAWSSGEHEIMVERDGSGNFELFVDDVSQGTVTDNTYTSGNYFMVDDQTNIGGNYTSIDNIEFAKTSGTWESAELDLLAVPTAWGILEQFHTLNGGTVVYKTAVASAPGGPYDAWTALGGGGTIQSALKRYLKIQVVITEDLTTHDSPVIQKIVANFTTTTVPISIAIHAGKTAWDMVQDYAKIANYETGFDADGIFFFRSKSVTGSPVIELDQENVISEINDYSKGYEDIANAGQVQYGDYFNEYDGATAGESSPTSEERFGRLIQYEDFSSILLANDANLAVSRAQLIYDDNYLPRINFTVIGKIVPWLELSDIVRINYFDHPLLKDLIFGDPLQKFGASHGGFGDAQNVLARDLDMKIIGLNFLPDDHKCELTLQEVLT